jgi:hypothetical protein
MLPTTWPDRGATLDAASRLDEQHESDALAALLDAWGQWERRGAVPAPGPLRDVIAVLAHLLGGVAHELRRRPREGGLHGRAHG